MAHGWIRTRVSWQKKTTNYEAAALPLCYLATQIESERERERISFEILFSLKVYIKVYIVLLKCYFFGLLIGKIELVKTDDRNRMIK